MPATVSWRRGPVSAVSRPPAALRRAVRWGRRGARLEYTLLLAIAFAAPGWLWLEGMAPAGVSISLLAVPLAAPLLRSVWTSTSGSRLNLALAGTARLLAVHALLLAVGWLL